MIGQLLGRPSPALRRGQVFLILFFWIWRLYKGDGSYMRSTPTGYNRSMPSHRVRPVAHLAPTIAVPAKVWWRRVWSFLVARRTGTRWMTNINERLSESHDLCKPRTMVLTSPRRVLHPVSAYSRHNDPRVRATTCG